MNAIRHRSLFSTLRRTAMTTLFAFAGIAGLVAQPAFVPNSAVKADKVGQTVTIAGRISNITPPTSERAPYGIYITDDSVALRLVIFQDMFKQIKNPEQFAIGARVKATGEVKEYRGSIEVHLSSADGLQLYDGPAAAAAAPATSAAAAAAPAAAPASAAIPAPANLAAIKSITAAADGKTVTIRGKVASVRPSTRENVPTIVSVQDDSGAIDVVYWDDVGSLIPYASKPAVGAQMQISGKVNVYREKPQIRLGAAADIIKLGAAASTAAAPAASSSVPAAAAPAAAMAAPAPSLAGVQFTPTAKIEKSMLGQPVAVSGKISRVIPVNGGKLVEITDDSGKIMVPCWESAVGGSPFYATLKEGAAIAVQGEVDFFEQRQQVQVKLKDAAGLLSVK